MTIYDFTVLNNLLITMSISNKIGNFLIHLKSFNFLKHKGYYIWLKENGYLKVLPDELYIKLEYHRKFGKSINLKTPRTFNEKLQWLKLHDRVPYYSLLADKYEVKNYLSKIIKQEYILESYDVYNHVKEVNLNTLPDKFILKTTHDSGGVYICTNKESFNQEIAEKQLEPRLKENWYWREREWVYKDIKPRIIAERYLEDIDNPNVLDYKFFCFNGKALYFKIDFDRYINHKANYYDINGNLQPFGEIVCPPDFNRKLPIPENLDEMIELAEKIAQNITFLRVDLYNINKKIYFGEATFYPNAGFGPFTSDEWDYKLGELLVLPKSH